MSCDSPTTKPSSSTHYQWRKRYKEGSWQPSLTGDRIVGSQNHHIWAPCASGGSPPGFPGFRMPTAYAGRHVDRYSKIQFSDVRIGSSSSWEYETVGGITTAGTGTGYPEIELTTDVSFRDDSCKVPTYQINRLKAESIDDCMSKFRDGTVDLSEAFLERKQTLGLAQGLLDDVRNLLKNLQRRNLVKVGDSLAGIWLAGRYGLAPLFADLYGLLETIQAKDAGSYDSRYILTAKSRATDTHTFSIPVKNRAESFGYGFYWDGEVKGHVRLGAFTRVDAYVPGSTGINRLLSDIGVSNPISSLWNYLPYTFVADWFWNVGTWLQAFVPPVGLQFLGGSTTWYYAGGYAQTVDKVHHPVYPSASGSGLCVEPYSVLEFSRQPYGTWPHPPLYTKRHPIDFKRFWDSVFLLKQALRGGPIVIR